jgi:hypothetical protein
MVLPFSSLRRLCDFGVSSVRGWVARYVIAVPWQHCWDVPSHLSDRGVADATRNLYTASGLRACVRCGVDPSESLHRNLGRLSTR